MTSMMLAPVRLMRIIKPGLTIEKIEQQVRAANREGKLEEQLAEIPKHQSVILVQDEHFMWVGTGVYDIILKLLGDQVQSMNATSHYRLM